MPRRVDDVDFGAVPAHGAVLGGNRDTALPLQVHAVHHAFGDDLPLPEHAAVAEHRVHERGLAMVDVGDDRGVANVVVAAVMVHTLGTNVLLVTAFRQAVAAAGNGVPCVHRPRVPRSSGPCCSPWSVNRP